MPFECKCCHKIKETEIFIIENYGNVCYDCYYSDEFDICYHCDTNYHIKDLIEVTEPEIHESVLLCKGCKEYNDTMIKLMGSTPIIRMPEDDLVKCTECEEKYYAEELQKGLCYVCCDQKHESKNMELEAK